MKRIHNFLRSDWLEFVQVIRNSDILPTKIEARLFEFYSENLGSLTKVVTEFLKDDVIHNLIFVYIF